MHSGENSNYTCRTMRPVNITDNLNANILDFDSTGNQSDVAYDYTGSVCFTIAIICIYGISIALLIASSVRHNKTTDYDLESFIKSYEQVELSIVMQNKMRMSIILQERMSVVSDDVQLSTVLEKQCEDVQLSTVSEKPQSEYATGSI